MNPWRYVNTPEFSHIEYKYPYDNMHANNDPFICYREALGELLLG